MTSTAALTQKDFVHVRSLVAFAIRGQDPILVRDPLEADEKERAENIMQAGYVDVARVLGATKESGDLPPVHSVIEVPVPGQEMSNTYFVESSDVSGLGVHLIKSDYDRDRDFGRWLQLEPTMFEGWKYVYPQDDRA